MYESFMSRFADLTKSFRTPWLLATAAALCLSVAAVWWGGLNQDEGWYLYAAQMVHAGKLPYHDFFYTQGPAMPFVYSALSPIWTMPGSPLHGLLGGRILTLLFGFAATACAVALARRLVPADRRPLAGFAVFTLLACNLYHLYFTAIPKTYALGSLFVLAGFLLVTAGLQTAVRVRSAFLLAAGGLSLAFATGTRISLLLILPVVGGTLLLCFRAFRWSFLWFGLGAAAGLFLTYGLFALDPASLQTLLAAQRYHAARGGFDPFFAVGSVSRWARGYAALGVVLFAAAAFGRRASDVDSAATSLDSVSRTVLWMLGLGFAAVFVLQISAPFPYDDYQVPLMGMLTVLIVVWFARTGSAAASLPRAWFVFLATGLVSFTSPLLQEWATYPQDRFWSRTKEMTELAKLRATARRLNALDPGGTTLLTQDLYLAVEAGRTVPAGLEMGPFSYFPDVSTADATAVHVLNRARLEALFRDAPCTAAAVSGYGFAIAAPSCRETSRAEQAACRARLAETYDLVETVERFGQNATPLSIYVRKKERD